MDPKEPGEPGADVVSIEAARHKAAPGEAARHDAEEATAEARATVGDADAPTVTVNGAEFLKPVMAAIARELANVADPDGTVRVGGTDEASRAKTAAVVKGLGMGLGQALAQAFGKWAEKIETGQVKGPEVTGTIQTAPSPTADDPDKDPS